MSAQGGSSDLTLADSTDVLGSTIDPLEIIVGSLTPFAAAASTGINGFAITVTSTTLSQGNEFTLDIDAGELIQGAAVVTTNATSLSAGVILGQDGLETRYEVTEDVTMTVVDTAGVGAELIGGSGNDTLTGGAGNDTFIGGAGADIMDGGATPAVGATYTVEIGGATTDSGADDGDTITIAGLTITTSATPTEDYEIGANADADQIGAKFAAQSLDDWKEALGPDGNDGGLTQDQADTLVSVTYDSVSNQLVFSFDGSQELTGLDGTITAPDATGAVLAASVSSTDFEAATAGNNLFFYFDAGDSQKGAMDQILNFNVAGSTDVLDFSEMGLTFNNSNEDLGVSLFALTNGNAMDDTFIAFEDGDDVFLFVDANDDGVFNAADDMVIKLVGIEYTDLDYALNFAA